MTASAVSLFGAAESKPAPASASSVSLDDRFASALALLQAFDDGGDVLSFDDGCPVCGVADRAAVVWDGRRAVHRACVGGGSSDTGGRLNGA